MLRRSGHSFFKGFGGSQLFGNFVNAASNFGGKGSGPSSSNGFPRTFGFSTSSGGTQGNPLSGIFGGSDAGQGARGGFGSFGGPLGGLFDKALEWCSESHARDIARRQGLDIRDLRFEKTAEGGVRVVVDAPSATPKQIEDLGEKVMQECPVARFRKTQVASPQQKMQWVRLPDRYDR